MPRRKPKSAFIPGQSGNPNGRPHGSVNEINNSIRTAFAMLLHNQLPQLESWLAEGAKRDPLKTADLLLRISERFTPSLSRTEITGADGQAFTPITINLPSIPNIRVGESSPIPLSISPTEEVKELGEGTSFTSVDGEDTQDIPIPWTIPVFSLPDSAIQAQAEWERKERGEGAPTQTMTLPKEQL